MDSIEMNIDDLPIGQEREAIVKQRINQSFFRSTVLSSYNFKCCISGVGNPELLEACHIVDWSRDIANRINPKNGLCMNSFFHKAYDKLLIAITPDFTIVVSEELFQKTSDSRFQNYLSEINNERITLPDKFFPDRNLLQLHFENFQRR